MPSKVEVKQIVELGREERVEYSGKIRPIGSEDGALAYECLVCGNIWPHEAPSGARQSSTSFLHPVTEREED